jgi:catechol-2,3-dioxygenase
MEIRQIHMYTGTFEQMLEFYQDLLEFKVEVVNKGQEFNIKVGTSTLKFSYAAGNPAYHFAFNIPSNKIEEASEWLAKRTPLLWLEESNSFIANFDSWHAKSVYFIDPAGNIGEFIARFDLNDNVEEMFSPAHLRCVSEVGIVFPKSTFDEDVKKLLSRYPLQYFDKQPPLEQFRAIGDDHGLFIVVPDNRKWYPTSDRPSGIHPLSVQFNAEGNEYRFSEPGDDPS